MDPNVWHGRLIIETLGKATKKKHTPHTHESTGDKLPKEGSKLADFH